MAISENASLGVSRQPDPPGEFSERAYHQVSLPLHPLLKIRARKKWMPLELRDIWDHRELLYFMVGANLKLHIKKTQLEWSWVVLQPILMTLVFTVFLGKIARVPSGNVPYVLFLYSGLLPWTFFSNARN